MQRGEKFEVGLGKVQAVAPGQLRPWPQALHEDGGRRGRIGIAPQGLAAMRPRKAIMRRIAEGVVRPRSLIAGCRMDETQVVVFLKIIEVGLPVGRNLIAPFGEVDGAGDRSPRRGLILIP